MLRERQELRKKVFSPFSSSSCTAIFPRQGGSEGGRAERQTALARKFLTATAGWIGNGAFCSRQVQQERELEPAGEKNQRRNKMEGSRKRGERAAAGLRLTAEHRARVCAAFI